MQRTLGFWSCLGLGLFSTTTWADDPTTVLETIRIQADTSHQDVQQNSSGTKFSHDVLDIPFNRSFISQQVIEQQDVQRIDDALTLVSGVFHQSTLGGGFWDNYSIRGFSTDPNLGAAMIRNGLSVNRGISAPKDMVNIESLDFLKGPMAALYGRGETGGLLNINSKKPQWESESEIHLRATSQEQYRISLEHTAPINDTLAYRFAMAHEDNQSFRDHVSSERWFFSPQLTWKISDQTRLDFDSELTQQLGTFDRGISTVQKKFVMNPKTFTGEPRDGDMRVKDHFYQLRLSHEFNDAWKLNSALSYKDAQLTGFSTEPRRMQADGRTLERQRRYRNYQSEDLLAQAELLGKLDSSWARHEVVVSTELGQLDYRQYQQRRNHSAEHPNTIDIYQPRYGQYLPSLAPFTDTDERQRYFALNLQDQMFLNDQWSILVGTRFDRVEQNFENHLSQTQHKQTLNQASPRFGINFKASDQWSLYSNYGRSFAMNSGMDRNGENFAPEKGQSYEVGSKYQFNDRSLLSLALFKMQKQNVLTTDPMDGNFQTAAGEVSSQGIELDFNSQFTDRWSLNANYSYTDAKIEKDQDLAAGARLSNIPKHQASISSNYEFLQQGATRAGVGANISYVGERSGHNLDNGFDLPSYSLVNLNAYYAPSDRLRYQFNLNNLLDKTYYVSSYSDLWVQPGEPLNASISAQFKF
ncbi:TonB-dependent siderophore receptor [Acinetobacter halotolerans]|uniref:TonB-dependent siderophore receptor n=1 Tax=Acinetobacter halotolerans TaxID=1752076 RepID=A0A4Q6XA15_9GAMM|nr:TonB-dependent siderophore receptor [Acinetobacter halotolerans]RZF51175.1 TonB-dependent siderophore receptor [Acinetobacter halotolerans]